MSGLSSRAVLLAAFIPGALVLAGFGKMPRPGTATEGPAADVRVGHSLKQLVVPGSRPDEGRRVDVHLWYPAGATGFPEAPKTFYTSALYGERLIAELGDPLSWKIEAEIARENVGIDSTGKAFPVIVFSHGSTNDPIDYAYTLELIAAAGFMVAAPAHVNNTQDDVRTDYVNAQAALLGKPPVLRCRDGLPPPCVRSLGTDVPRSMADRVRDISYVLNALPGWYGGHVDVSRAGVMGHSRGTVTALTAAGGSLPGGSTTGCGSAPWSITADPRIKAVMGLAIGAAPVTFCANLANVTVPALLVAGTLDANSAPAVSKAAHDRIGSTKKEFVALGDAMHRSFDSTYCAQMQAAGAVAQGNARAILDKQTLERIVVDPLSGVAMDYCSLASFTSPVDVRPMVTSITGFNFAAQHVPRSGLNTEAVKQWVKERAVAFFGGVLTRDPTPPAIGTHRRPR
jgi:predicted dienelactone hydrolase